MDPLDETRKTAHTFHDLGHAIESSNQPYHSRNQKNDSRLYKT